jgi:3-methyladenine DNA glycosylase AlkD
MTPAKSPTLEEVLSRLEAERDERGMARWGDGGIRTGGLRSFGIGLTRLRAIGKSIGRDRALAQALWHTDLHEARVLSLLIDDPAQITREQAEQQVEQVDAGQLAHVFASCDATLARTPFVVELADAWTRSNDPVRRDCGYGLLYEVSKSSGRKAPADDWFLGHIDRIAASIDDEPERVRLAMATALMGIGKRNAALNRRALAVARAAGPIEFTSASGKCEPFDVSKHLDNERLRAKLGIVDR